jgi:hypothetical protein
LEVIPDQPDLPRIPETVFPMGLDSMIPMDRTVTLMGEKDLPRIPETVIPMGVDFKPPMDQTTWELFLKKKTVVAYNLIIQYLL